MKTKINDNEEKGISEMKFIEKDLLDKGYLKVWMLFEVQSASKKATESALKKHINKIKSNFNINVVNENMTDIERVEAGKELKVRNINILYSQINEMIFFIDSYEKLMELVINYGPTAVEIIAPEKITLDMRQAQNSLVMVADMMHKFALQGIGGILIKS